LSIVFLKSLVRDKRDSSRVSSAAATGSVEGASTRRPLVIWFITSACRERSPDRERCTDRKRMLSEILIAVTVQRRETRAWARPQRPSVLMSSSKSLSAVTSTREAASKARWYLVKFTISSSSETPLMDSRT